MNVHGFGDFRDPEPNQEPENTTENLFDLPQFEGGNPRQENYCDMLKQGCCPYFKLLSATTLIMVVFLVLFIVPLAMNGLYVKGTLLEATSTAILNFGGNQPVLVKTGEVQRLLAPFFLHQNLLYYVFDSMLFVYLMSAFQKTFSFIRPTAIFVLSGISGCIFTDVIAPTSLKINIGSIIGTFGLMGASIFYGIVNWNELGDCMRKFRVFSTAIFSLLMGIFLTLGAKYLDAYALLGSFFPGFLLGGLLPTKKEETLQKVARIVGLAGFGVWQVVVFLVFYLSK